MGESFEKILTRFSKGDQEKIRVNLDSFINSAEGGEIGEHIRDENHVHEMDDYEKVIKIFIRKKKHYIADYLKVCEEINISNGGSGKQITKRPEVVGKVMPRPKYENLLKERHNMDEDDIKEFYYCLFKKKDLSDYTDLYIGKGITWVTWNEDDTSSDPFHYLQKVQKDEGLACRLLSHNLGLHSDFAHLNQTAFIYPIKDVELKYPTCIDARGYHHFRPSPRSSDYGYTRHYHPPKDQKRLLKHPIGPRPEGIHLDLKLHYPEYIEHKEFH